MINKSLDEIDTLADTLEENLNKSEEESNKKRIEASEVAEGEDEGTEESEGAEEGTEEPTVEAEGDEEDVDVDEEDEEEEGTEKSLEEELSSNDSVRKALEVSEFLQEFVKSMETTINSYKDTVSKSIQKSANESDMMLAKSVQGLVKSQKSIADTQVAVLKGFNDLNQRLDQIEHQPLTRKSLQSSTQAIDKSFESSLGDSANAGTSSTDKISLSKSQAVTKLTNAFEKGNSDLRDDILALDSTGDFNTLSEEAKTLLSQ